MGVQVNGQWYSSGVVDYLTPAEKAAKRAKDQAQQAYQYAVEHEQNKMDTFIDPVDTITKTVKGFGDLLTINRTVQDIKKSSEDRAQKNTNAKLKRFADNPKDKDAIEAALIYKNREKDVRKNEPEFLEFVAGLDASENVKNYLRESSAGELLRAAKWIGSYSISTAYQDFTEDHILKAYGPNPEESRLKFDTTIGNDPDKVRSAFNDFAIKRLTALGINDDLITHNYIPSIHEISDTLSGSAISLYKVESLTTAGKLFSKNIDAARKDELKNNPNALTEVVHETILKLAKPVAEGGKGLDVKDAKRQVTSMLVMQVLDKSLSYAEFTDIKNGLNLGNNPAGKTGTVLLDKEQYALIEKAFIDMGEHEVKLLKEERDNGANIAIAGLKSGNLDINGRDEALRTYISKGGKDTDALYIQIENTNPNKQTKAAYNRELPSVELALSDGRTKVSDITIENLELLDHKQTEEDERTKWRELNGYHKDNSEEWGKKTVVQRGRKSLRAGDIVGSGSPEMVANFIALKRDKIIHDVFRSGGTKADVEAQLNSELALLGFDVPPGEFDNPDAGILTPDIEGNFPAFEATYLAEKNENKVNVEISANEIQRVFNKKLYRNFPGKTDKQKLINSGLVISNAEIVNLAQNFRAGKGDEKGTITWTKDVLLKAHILGVEPEVLVAGKLNAMLDDKNNKTAQMLVKSYDLENMLNGLPQSNVEVRQFLEKLGEKKLLALYEQLGVENLSPNQLTRLISLENQINNLRGLSRRQQKINALTNWTLNR